jgi:prefoldin beta subunit
MESKDKQIEEIQILEQTLHNISFQKQAFQLELSEISESLNSLQSSGEEVFKIIGQLMIKTDKKKIQEELANKQKLLELRTKSIEKEEDSISKRVISLREELISQKKK